MRLSTAKEIILASFKNRSNGIQSITPYLEGSAGLGKTTVCQSCAEELGVEFRSEIVAQRDAGEMGGLIFRDENNEAGRLRPDWLPSEGEGILLLDELGQAPMANLNIVAQLVNERRIGEHALGDGWIIVCAGNSVKHRAGSNALPTHLKDRLLHLDIEADLDDALDYMNSKSVAPEIIGYLKFRPTKLSEFDKDAKAFPSPRSWHKTSEILSWGLSETAEFEAIRGQVGDSASADFKAYLKVFRALPDPEAPLKTPDTADIPAEPSVLFAVCANIAHRVNKSNVDNFCKYLGRLPQQEFSAFAIKSVFSRWPDIKREKAFVEWFKAHGKALV